jgi:cyanophycinase
MSPAIALLGSGEFEPWTEEVDRRLLERSRRAGAGDGRVLILPAASAPEGDAVFDMWANMGLTHYGRVGIAAEVVPIKTREDADRPDFVDRLAHASMVFFSGGNPAALARILDGSAFWNLVVDRLEEGMAFAGCSAGVACLGEMAPDSSTVSLDPENLQHAGLRLFPKMLFGPHWDALDGFVPGLRDLILAMVPADCRLLAIDERTAVVGDGASWTVIGSGGAALYDRGERMDHPAGRSFSLALLPDERPDSVPVE